MFLILILFQSTLRFESSSVQPPAIAVLIDNSQSITLNNGNVAVKEFLAGNPFDDLPDGVVRNFYAFSASPEPMTVNDATGFTGEVTDISAVISAMKDSVQGHNLSAVVIISDGNFTRGKNPIYAAEEMPVPVFTVGVGDSAEPKDVVISGMIANNITYSNTRTPVDVRVKCSGYTDEKIEIALLEGSKLSDRALVSVTAGTREYKARLYFNPGIEGVKKLTVTASALPGEVTLKNNSQSLFVKVLKNKVRLSIIAGAPDPDLSAIRQAMSENEQFLVDAAVQKSAEEFYGRPDWDSLLDSADCLAMIGFPTKGSSGAVLNRILSAVEKYRKPLFFINSKNVDYSKLSLFREYLPFSWNEVRAGELLLHGTLTERGAGSTVVSLQDGGGTEPWQRLPPIYKSKTTFRIKPESENLIRWESPDQSPGEVLLGLRNINRHKALGMTGYGIWRWRLLSQNDPLTEKLLSTFLNNAFRWLTAPEENKRFRVSPTKEFFTSIEPVQFTAELYDDQLRPVEDAGITVRMQGGAEILLNSIGNGRYEGSFGNVSSGDYSFTASAKDDDRLIGSDSGKFSVGGANVEFLETKLNKSLLRQIAGITGGSYNDIASARRISDEIASMAKFGQKEVTQTDEIELWSWKYLAGLIIFLFALEWFLRKRSGML